RSNILFKITKKLSFLLIIQFLTLILFAQKIDKKNIIDGKLQKENTLNTELNLYKFETIQREFNEYKEHSEKQIKDLEISLKEFSNLKSSHLEEKINIYIACILGALALISFFLNFFGRRAIKQRTEKIIEETAFGYVETQTKEAITNKVTDDFVSKLTREKAESEILKIIKEIEHKGLSAISTIEKQGKDAIESFLSQPSLRKTSINKNSTDQEINASKEQSRTIEFFNLALKSEDPMVQIELYKKVIEIDKKEVSAYSNIGVSFLNINRPHLAIEYLNKAIEINPKYAVAYANRANAYNQLGELQKAMLDIDKAIELNPKLEFAYSIKGNILTKQGKNLEAESILNNAISINPNSSFAYFNRGYFYDNIKEYEKSKIDYDKAMSLGFSNKAMLYNNYAVLFRHKKEYNKAIEFLEKARAENPDFPNLEGTMALIYADQGNTEKFYHHIKLALEKGCKVWDYLDDPGFKEHKDSERLTNLLKSYKKNHLA
ncbi:MAG: tetratricopeptide repeat protein, partial [Bacteroidetes bacterium]|nr:tetratricopeptide repeat protein [Bacteroidota bacterium]